MGNQDPSCTSCACSSPTEQLKVPFYNLYLLWFYLKLSPCYHAAAAWISLRAQIQPLTGASCHINDDTISEAFSD